MSNQGKTGKSTQDNLPAAGGAGPFFFMPQTTPGADGGSEPAVTQDMPRTIPVPSPQPVAASLAPMVMDLDDIRLPDSTPRAAVPPVGSPPDLEMRLKAEKQQREVLEARVQTLEHELRTARARPAAETGGDVEALRGELVHRRLEITNLLRRTSDAEALAASERQRADELDKRLNTLSAQAARLESDATTWKSQVLQLEGGAREAASLRGQLEALRESVQLMTADLAQTRRRRDEAADALAAEQSNHYSLQTQFNSMTERLYGVVAQLREEQKARGEFEARVDISAHEARHFQALVSGAQADAAALRETLDGALEKLKQRDGECAALKQRVGALERQVDQEQGRSMETDLELNDVRDGHREELAALHQRLDDAAQHSARLALDLQAAQSAVDELTMDRTRLVAAQAQLAEQQRELTRLSVAETELTTALRQQEDAAMMAGGELKTALEQVQRLQAREGVLSAQLKLLSPLPERLAEATTVTRRQAEELAALEATVGQQQARAAQQRSELDEKVAALARAEKDVQAIREQLNARVVQMGVLESGLEDQRRAVAEVAELKRQLAEGAGVQRKVSDVEARLSAALVELSDARTSLAAAQDETAALQRRSFEVEAQLASEKKRAAEHASEMFNASEGLIAAQTALAVAFDETSVLQKKHEALERALAVEKQRDEERESELGNLRQDRDAARMSLDHAHAQQAELTIQLKDMDGRRAREKSRAEDREKDIRSLASDVQKAEELASTLEANLAQEKTQAEERVDRLRAQLDAEITRADQAQRDLRKATADEDELRNKVTRLQAELDARDALAARLEALLEQAAESAAAAFETQSALTQERDALAEKLKTSRH